MFFAGFWTPWKGVKKVRDGEREFELFGFLTTSPNGIVKPIHFKAMPAILTTPEEVDLWLTGDWKDVEHLQRPQTICSSSSGRQPNLRMRTRSRRKTV